MWLYYSDRCKHKTVEANIMIEALKDVELESLSLFIIITNYNLYIMLTLLSTPMIIFNKQTVVWCGE